MLKITNQILKDEAERRGWRVRVLDENSGFLEYTLPSGKKVLLQSCLSPFLPATVLKIANNKKLLYQIADENGIKIPKTSEIFSIEDLEELLDQYTSLVVKPIDGAHGNGVVTNVKNIEDGKKALQVARSFSDRVLVQEQVYGDDFRLLFINYELVAACIRKPAVVFGDGENTIRQLIKSENESDRRAPNYVKSLNLIDQQAAERFLGEKIDEIPSKDEEIIVVGTANIGTGGEAVDITAEVSKEMVDSGHKLLKSLNMPLGAVDFMGNSSNFYLLEINANPSLGLHKYPSSGSSQPVDSIFLNWIEDETR